MSGWGQSNNSWGNNSNNTNNTSNPNNANWNNQANNGWGNQSSNNTSNNQQTGNTWGSQPGWGATNGQTNNQQNNNNSFGNNQASNQSWNHPPQQAQNNNQSQSTWGQQPGWGDQPKNNINSNNNGAQQNNYSNWSTENNTSGSTSGNKNSGWGEQAGWGQNNNSSGWSQNQSTTWQNSNNSGWGDHSKNESSLNFNQKTVINKSGKFNLDADYYIETALCPDMVLEVSQNAASLNRIVLWKKNGNPLQKFKLRESNNRYFISNATAGVMIEVPNKSQAKGVNIFAGSQGNEIEKQWDFVESKNKDGSFYIKSFCGKCLDVCEQKTSNGTPIIQYNYNGDKNQIWHVKPA